jgi:hypothetical protein
MEVLLCESCIVFIAADNDEEKERSRCKRGKKAKPPCLEKYGFCCREMRC